MMLFRGFVFLPLFYEGLFMQVVESLLPYAGFCFTNDSVMFIENGVLKIRYNKFFGIQKVYNCI